MVREALGPLRDVALLGIVVGRAQVVSTILVHTIQLNAPCWIAEGSCSLLKAVKDAGADP